VAVVDAVGVLSGPKVWPEKDQQGMEKWFGSFLEWLQLSPSGRGEAASANNHTLPCQVPDCALFVGKQDWARKTMEEAKSKPIAAQIEADGRQSLELQRTKAFSYSCMNLRGLIELAQLGDVVGGDLWHYQSSDARSIRRAVDYLLPCATGEKKWEYKQLVGLDPTELTSGLLQASVGYGDAVYERAAETIGTKSGESVLRLAIRIRKEASPGGN